MRLILALLLAFGLTTPAFAAPEVGKAAPAFETTDIDGKPVSLAALKGKTVVLEWTNHLCPFVEKFYKPGKMQALQQAAIADSVVWLTINSSAEGRGGHIKADEAKKIAAGNGWAGSAFLLDPLGTIGKAYDAKVTPHMYVIDKEGVLAYAGAIDDKESTNSDDIAGAKNHVEAALANLKAGKPVEVASTRAYGCGVKYPH